MATFQCSLQHASSSSVFGQPRASRVPHSARMSPTARRPLRVQAVAQPDMMVAATNLVVTTINSAFWTSVVGGAFGAASALSRRGETKAVLQEAALNASGSMRVGALMGLASGTLTNLGLEGPTASMGGIALGLGLYATLVTATNKSK